MTSPDSAVWVLAPAASLPTAWAERGTPMVLVRLPAADLDLLGAPVRGQRGELLRLAAKGTPRNDIARELGVSTRTVDRWLADLRRQLGVRTTAELAARLTDSGW